MNTTEISQLRRQTGASFIACAQALRSFPKIADAIASLIASGQAKADRLNARQTQCGRLFSYVHTDGLKGSALVLLCETDFVARNEEFIQLGNDLAMQLTVFKVGSVDELLCSPFIKDPTTKIRDRLSTTKASLGENIRIGRFECFQV